MSRSHKEVFSTSKTTISLLFIPLVSVSNMSLVDYLTDERHEIEDHEKVRVVRKLSAKINDEE